MGLSLPFETGLSTSTHDAQFMCQHEVDWCHDCTTIVAHVRKATWRNCCSCCVDSRVLMLSVTQPGSNAAYSGKLSVIHFFPCLAVIACVAHVWYAQVFTSMHGYAGVCYGMLRYAQVCRGILGYAHHCIQEHVGVCRGMHGHGYHGMAWHGMAWHDMA